MLYPLSYEGGRGVRNLTEDLWAGDQEQRTTLAGGPGVARREAMPLWPVR